MNARMAPVASSTVSPPVCQPGLATVIVWADLQGGLFDVYEILPGFLISTLAIVIGPTPPGTGLI